MNRLLQRGLLAFSISGVMSCAVPPTRAQLEALDELADYLAMTTGTVPVAGHRADTGGPASCLGTFFPDEEIAAGLHASAR